LTLDLATLRGKLAGMSMSVQSAEAAVAFTAETFDIAAEVEQGIGLVALHGFGEMDQAVLAEQQERASRNEKCRCEMRHTQPTTTGHSKMRPCGVQLPGRSGVGLLAILRGSVRMFDRRLDLELRLPLRVGHAVNGLAGFILGEVEAAFRRGFAIPVGKAVATEAGKIHQVDVLYVRALIIQVL
jgi:hypothetical protein